MISQRVRELLLAKVCENGRDGAFIIDSHFHYLWVNQSFSTIVNYKEKDIIGQPIGIVKRQDLADINYKIVESITHALQQIGAFDETVTVLVRGKSHIDADITVWHVKHADIDYYVGLLRDISSTTAAQRSLFQLKHYNQITGLPNRHFFINQVNEYILDTYQELALARFSIDRYDALSQAFTEEQISSLLKQITGRINHLDLENLESFAHFDGAEFALLFETPYADEAGKDLDLIMQQFELPFVIEGERIHVHISIGVSYYRDHASQTDKLLRRAEQALTQAKKNGGDSIVWFDQSIAKNTLLTIQLETQVRKALTDAQFLPLYQPKFNLSTGEISGFEALVRWQHPTRGLLSPQHFLNMIIESRLSFELYCHMTLMVATQLTRWSKMDIETTICVNTDAAEFRDPSFLKFTTQVLADYDIAPHQFQIEMTESSLMINDETSLNNINAIKAAGINIALDDFGTGYASLSYLHHYPFDCVKIDQSFINTIATNDKQCNIVKAIIIMVHNLGMWAIAEGIESKEQADILRDLGCDEAQGYYFGRPLSAEDATTLLLEHKRGAY